MALQVPTFNFSGGGDLAPSLGGLGQGLAQAITGVRQGRQQRRQQEEGQRILSEGSILSSIVHERDPERRLALIETFSKDAAPEFQQELTEFGSLPFEQQDLIARASLIEDGLGNLVPKEVVDENRQKIRAETRSGLRKDLTTISKDANTISTNFNKLKNLSGQIESGNRQAVAQGLVALVKIGDPGSTVRSEEMKDALNTQNPLASVAGLLSNANTSEDVIRSVTASIDPLNPRNVKIDDFLSTAEALVSANVPSIQGRFSTAKESAQTNLTDAGVKSLFTEGIEKTVSGLSELQFDKGSNLKSEFQKLNSEQRKLFLRNATDEELKEAGVL